MPFLCVVSVVHEKENKPDFQVFGRSACVDSTHGMTLRVSGDSKKGNATNLICSGKPQTLQLKLKVKTKTHLVSGLGLL